MDWDKLTVEKRAILPAPTLGKEKQCLSEKVVIVNFMLGYDQISIDWHKESNYSYKCSWKVMAILKETHVVCSDHLLDHISYLHNNK